LDSGRTQAGSNNFVPSSDVTVLGSRPDKAYGLERLGIASRRSPNAIPPLSQADLPALCTRRWSCRAQGAIHTGGEAASRCRPRHPPTPVGYCSLTSSRSVQWRKGHTRRIGDGPVLSEGRRVIAPPGPPPGLSVGCRSLGVREKRPPRPSGLVVPRRRAPRANPDARPPRASRLGTGSRLSGRRNHTKRRGAGSRGSSA